MLKKWRSFNRLRIVFTLLVVIVLVMGGLGLYFSPSPSNQLEAQNSRTYSCNNTHMTEVQIAAYRNLAMVTFESLVSKRNLTPSAICVFPADELKDEIE